ncbi:hypothetical protein CFE70_003119 [Pyrenophora teres f. teres 0-1]
MEREIDQEAATAYWQTVLADCEVALFPPLPSTAAQPVADTTTSTLTHPCSVGPGARHACGFQTQLVVQPTDDVLGSDDTLGEWRGRSELQDFTTYSLMVQCTLAGKRVQVTAILRYAGGSYN